LWFRWGGGGGFFFFSFLLAPSGTMDPMGENVPKQAHCADVPPARRAAGRFRPGTRLTGRAGAPLFAEERRPVMHHGQLAHLGPNAVTKVIGRGGQGGGRPCRPGSMTTARPRVPPTNRVPGEGPLAHMASRSGTKPQYSTGGRTSFRLGRRRYPRRDRGLMQEAYLGAGTAFEHRKTSSNCELPEAGKTAVGQQAEPSSASS